MAGLFRELLAKDTLARDVRDYEDVYDDFIRYAGGVRVSERFNIPKNQHNADYYIECEGYDCIVELKQVQKYLTDATIDSYFDQLWRNGELRNAFPHAQPGMSIKIRPEDLTPRQWRRFYEKFRPGVRKALDKANSQLSDSDKFIPRRHHRRVRAAIILNTNDYNLSTDLLFRIVERKVKLEWRANHYRSLDLVVCGAIDLFRRGQNALHARRIVRSIEYSVLVDAAWFINDRWIRYVASELGMEVTYSEDGNDVAPPPVEMLPAFEGKLRFVPT
jgi:hypothetical protein